MIKKIIILFSIVALSLSTGATTILAQNEEVAATDVKVEEMTTEDLGVGNPGLLPTSPFYFFKEWGRGIRSFFIFDPTGKAEFELKVVNEKAAELKKLEKTVPENTQALERAVQNYQTNAERLRVRLENLKETSENPNVDKLLNNIADKTLKHQQLFEELKQKQEILRSKIEEGQETLNSVVSQIPLRMESAEKFSERLENAVEIQKEGALKEIKALGIINKLEEKLPEEAKESMYQLKENLISKFEGRIKAEEILTEGLPELMENMQTSASEKVQVIEQIRERIEDAGVKSKLNVMRQDILETADMEAELTEEEIRRLINLAEKDIETVEKALFEASSQVRQSVITLIDKAKVHLEQARKYLETGDLGSAFGQATSAFNVSRNALAQVIRYKKYTSEFSDKIGDMEESVAILKTEYDKLLSEFQKIAEGEKETYSETYSKLRSSFNECEQIIVRFSSLISKIKEKGSFEIEEMKTAEELYRKIKTLLSSIRSLLGMIPQKIEETITEKIPPEKAENSGGGAVPVFPVEPPESPIEAKPTPPSIKKPPENIEASGVEEECPQVVSPSPAFEQNCKNKGGIVVPKLKDKGGCIVGYECRIVSETPVEQEQKTTESKPSILEKLNIFKR